MRNNLSKVLLLVLIVTIITGGLIVFIVDHKKVTGSYIIISNTFPHCKTDMFVAVCSGYSVKVRSDSGEIRMLQVSGFNDDRKKQAEFEMIGTELDAAEKGHKEVVLVLDSTTITGVAPYTHH